jgi:hypothetical protein
VLIVPRGRVNFSFIGPLGATHAREPTYFPLLDALADGARTFDDLLEFPQFGPLAIGMLLHGLS